MDALVAGYQIREVIYESGQSLIYRGYQSETNQPIILKVLKSEFPSPEMVARFKREFELTRGLQLDGVIRAYSLDQYHNSLAMVLEDFGGTALIQANQEKRFTLEEWLTVAGKITAVIGQLHERNLIHKDLNPANILYNELTGQVKIIDFGISTVLSRENPVILNPTVLEGTLAYMSPEQTGRMNRALDYRTDF
jgi:serine/threonine protein kinase